MLDLVRHPCHLTLNEKLTDLGKGASSIKAVHQMTWIDCLIRWIARVSGVIINGMTHGVQLESRLNQFDIYKLLATGKPYLNHALSEKAQGLILAAFADIQEDEYILDTHLHILGYDEGNFIKPEAINGWAARSRFVVIHAAAGVESPIGSTAQATQQLFAYAHRFPKFQGMILPIHKAYTNDGKVDHMHTLSKLSNGTAWKAAQNFNDPSAHLLAAVAIHPRDPRWEEKLDQAVQRRIRIVKLCPAQNVQPDLEENNAFYEALVKRKMVLISHSGKQHGSGKEGKWEDFTNPLRFRNALQKGVTLILAHTGHMDPIVDLDDPEKRKVPGHQLFARLAREAFQKNWPGKLYGDISAIQNHYGADFILELLKYSQEPGFRLLHGSAYPYTNLIQPFKDHYPLLAERGLLDPTIVSPLKEIRTWNPLLANYICARNLSFTSADGKTVRFPKASFTGTFEDAPLQNS